MIARPKIRPEVRPEIRKTGKRFLLALGLVLLLPGMVGAAGFGPAAEDSFWGSLADPMELVARVWGELTSLWTSGASIDPNGEGPAGACLGNECGPSIDPNG